MLPVASSKTVGTLHTNAAPARTYRNILITPPATVAATGGAATAAVVSATTCAPFELSLITKKSEFFMPRCTFPASQLQSIYKYFPQLASTSTGWHRALTGLGSARSWFCSGFELWLRLWFLSSVNITQHARNFMNEVLAAGQDSTRPLVYCELVRQALNCTRTYFLQQQQAAGRCRGRCRGSEQQAAGNSLSARLTNCVKALQQSANRFCCTSVPCSGALVASASSSSDGQQQQEQEQREADGAASPETGQAKPFHLRTATRLLNMIMRSIAGSQQQQQIAVWGNCKKEKGVREQGAGRRRQGERQRTITGSEAAPSVVTLAGNA